MDNHGVRWGIIAGVLVAIYTVALYLVDPNYLFYVTLSLVGSIIYIFCMRKAGLETRSDMGGYMTWGEAMKPTFITYAVGTLIGTIFMYVLFMVDESLPSLQYDSALASQQWIMESMGAPPDAIDQAREQMEAQMSPEQFEPSLLNSIKYYLGGLAIGGFILSAIISAIIRKKKPDDLILDQS
ncbi:MAG: DUF4199 domain-containing protein [Bacteroidota bacterium]